MLPPILVKYGSNIVVCTKLLKIFSDQHLGECVFVYCFFFKRLLPLKYFHPFIHSTYIHCLLCVRCWGYKSEWVKQNSCPSRRKEINRLVECQVWQVPWRIKQEEGLGTATGCSFREGGEQGGPLSGGCKEGLEAKLLASHVWGSSAGRRVGWGWGRQKGAELGRGAADLAMRLGTFECRADHPC